ncbi:PAS domain S-box protein [Hydrogenophaga pseudoflava]|uniref:PAS domain S-box protein n=1 Tax=Hydrogenophaga pseudoflava TaxID=47421 RepID=UPI0027E3CBAA|nr:PAS domain S-box protein [Hydrogenophaga pseudoflava]MDQ7743188.1 PAS domain S-box protein [Hydrogenophaga pseudoflava]
MSAAHIPRTAAAGRASPDWTERPAWRRYGVAVLLTLLAVWARMALAPADSGGRFITPALAVAFSALYGGLGPGLLSTALGMVLVNFFMVRPYGSFAFENPTEAFWLNTWHLITQLVVVGAIAMMQSRNRQLQEAGRQIRDGQQRLLDTFEQAASGISHVDPGGRLLRANQTFCRMVGYSPEELAQLSFQDITVPEDIGPDMRLLEEALAGKRSSYSLEKRYRHKDGHTVWVQLTVALVRTPEGAPDYFISVVQDLSPQKAAEEALRTSQNLMNQAQKLANIGAWQADLSTGRIGSITRSESFLSFPSNEYGIHDMLAMIHPDDRLSVQTLWPRAIKGEASYEIEYRVVLDGREYWHSVKAEFERDGQGRAVRALGVTQDITERKRIELEFQHLNATLEQRIRDRTRALRDAYDELESYSYAVAHDLRSPLRIINGFAQALRENNPALDAPSQDHLGRIMGASKKMGELIDGLLKLSQYARGEVLRQSVNLSAIATRIVEELSVAEPQRVVAWEIEPDLLVEADPALIEALMQNLLNNAWKYTAGVAQARIRVFSRQLDGVREYCVSDNGAGFDMARAGKLFQPFQRLHQPHEFAGLGIGLATARRIVQRHGGVLRAQSTPGEGAEFSFTLACTGKD